MAVAAREIPPWGRLRERMRSESKVRYLAWRASGTKRLLTVRLASGESLVLRPPPAGDLSVAHEIFAQEIYRSPRLLRAEAVAMIIDVGANIGYSILYFAYRYSNARVIGFEPHPAHLALAGKHLRINGLTERVKLVAAGAGNDERAGFLIDEGERSRVSEDGGRGRIPIRVVDLFDLIGDARIDLLKMDCEGGEYDLIMDERFASLDVHTIALEWHATGQHPHAREELRARLEELGFVAEGNAEKQSDGSRSGLLWAYR